MVHSNMGQSTTSSFKEGMADNPMMRSSAYSQMRSQYSGYPFTNKNKQVYTFGGKMSIQNMEPMARTIETANPVLAHQRSSLKNPETLSVSTKRSYVGRSKQKRPSTAASHKSAAFSQSVKSGSMKAFYPKGYFDRAHVAANLMKMPRFNEQLS